MWDWDGILPPPGTEVLADLGHRGRSVSGTLTRFVTRDSLPLALLIECADGTTTIVNWSKVERLDWTRAESPI